MAVILANDDILNLRVYCVTGDQLAINSFFLRVFTVIGSPTDVDVLTSWDVSFAPLYKALMTTDSTYRGTTVQRVRPAPTTMMATKTNLAGAGTVAAPPLPRQVSGIITKRTDFAGKGFRGRVYVPFPGEDSSSGATGTPVAGYVTNLAALALSIETPKAAGGGGNSCNSRVVLFKSVSGQTYDVTSCIARSIWATQRRRGSYGKANVSPI